MIYKKTLMRHPEHGGEVMFAFGIFSKKLKHAFFRMNSNTRWVKIPKSLYTTQNVKSWLKDSPEQIMAKIRGAQNETTR